MDKKGNPALHRKRLELQLSEQKLILDRQALRTLEIDEEKNNIKESMVLTQNRIVDLEKSLKDNGE